MNMLPAAGNLKKNESAESAVISQLGTSKCITDMNNRTKLGMTKVVFRGL